MRINVLDHGFVRLIDHMGDDLSIIRNARVSYNAEWRTGIDKGKDERLIEYLYENGHNTPFEAVVFTFEIKAPIFVIRQWHRHRTWSYSEVSARYTALPEEYYIPGIQNIGRQDEVNKQSRKLNSISQDEEFFYGAIRDTIRNSCKESFKNYKDLLEVGVPRELARTVLPLATYTHMFGTVNLHNLFRLLRERLHPRAQYEIRVYAEAMLEMVKEIVPVSYQCFIDEINKSKTEEN